MSKKLQELLSDSGCVSVREYSGRGMYGKKCLGITGSTRECMRAISDAVTSLMQESFDAAIDATEDSEVDSAHEINDENMDIVSQLLNYDKDSMGLDVIIYWPRIEFEGEEELDEEDEE